MAAGTEAGAGPTQDCFAQLDRGAQVDGFRVRRVLSRGNGGALHQARGEGGVRVLLRVLGARARAPEVRARIDADLERLERVDHRCVARLVARGDEFFALEHPGGLTLLELVRRGKPFDAGEVVWVGHGLASGLLALHAAGLAHGNVSPSAIHVTEEGPVLVDLGWPPRLGQGTAPSPASDVRALASTLTFAVVGAPTEAGDRVQVPGLPKEVASLLRAALDPASPAPAMDKVRRVFERAADRLGLLDQGGAPASLGRRLREAIKLHLASSASSGDPDSADGSSGAALDSAIPLVMPLQVDSLDLGGDSDSEARPLPAGAGADTRASDDSARAETQRRLVIAGDEPPPIRTPSGRVVPQNPFALASGPPSDRAPASGTGSGEQEAPSDLALRAGLELIHRRILGQGGMGVVHLVLDPRLGRRAALKLLRTPVTPSRVRRFRRETVVTARLDHPCIPPVYEAGTTPGGTHYLLMRFVEGESLAELLARRALGASRPRRERDREARELLHALVKVGEAVAYAHSKGIVHRDLKPANIMIGAFGEVLVMDWGLARDLHESSDEDAWIRSELGVAPPPEPHGDARAGITQDGAILGTPGYLAPEQARGEDVDARADVFSLGAVLCEVLTGRPPVIGPTVLAVLGLTRGGEVEFPHMRYVTVDPELDAIATRALAPDAEQRYATAEAFTEDLRAYLEGRNVSAYSYRPTERALRFVRRHPALFTVATVALAFLLWTHYLKEQARLREAAERRAQEAIVEARVGELLAQADTALDRKAFAQARTLFAQALTLDARSERARQGHGLAERFERHAAQAAAEEEQRRQAEERLRHEAEQAAEFVAQGDERLAGGELEAARALYEKAMAFGVVPEQARVGLARVEERLRLARQSAQERALLDRDAGQAARFVAEGQAHLRAGRARDAREAFIKALAFGSKDAERLLLQAEEALVAERGREVQAELARQAERLVQTGAAALARGQLEEARTAFLQALAFDGKSEAARQGLLDADRGLQAAAEAARVEDLRKERVRRVRIKQDQARAALARARELDRAGNAAEAREQFFAAIDLLDQALFMLPGDQGARQDKQAAARELAQHLFERGNQELGVFVLRLAGVDPGQAPADPEKDPDLAVVEADKVRISHAYDGAVRFQPSRAFDRVRDYVKQFGGRYRVTVQVRSEATQGNPPRVHATGFWLRVEDRQNNTVHPTIKIAFDGGPYVRPVTVDPTGRTITPFERALHLDVERWVREVEGHLKAIFEPPAPAPGQ